jgi:hypothetical protein
MSIFTCFDEGSFVDLTFEMVFVTVADVMTVIVLADFYRRIYSVNGIFFELMKGNFLSLFLLYPY